MRQSFFIDATLNWIAIAVQFEFNEPSPSTASKQTKIMQHFGRALIE